MHIHLSSLSSFLNDGCDKWFEERGMKVSLLSSLANDRGAIGGVLDGTVKCCSFFMWDCGAVSVRNKKIKITLEDFVQSVREIPPSVVPITIVGLDVIGDPITSQKNYLRLKYDFGFGNGFLPTFHYGEDMSYLETIVEEGFDYIGLGGVGAGDRLSQEPLRDWIRNVMFVNGDNRTLRYPHVKWHGFAQTSKITMAMFPYYSVDSAAWVKNSMLGKILTPFGDWRASDDPRTGIDVQHIERAGEKTLQKLEEWFATLGFTLDQVVKGRFEKHIVNCNYFLDLEKNHNWQPSNVEHRNIYSLVQSLGIVPVKKEVQKLDLNLIGIQKELPIDLENNFNIQTNLEEQETLTIKEVIPTMPREEKAAPLDALRALATKKVEQYQGEIAQVDIMKDELPRLRLDLLLPPQVEQKPVESIIESPKLIQPEQHEQVANVQPKLVTTSISIIDCPHCHKMIRTETTTTIVKQD